MVDFVEFGSILFQARISKKITQEGAAEIVGVAVETIRNIEHGYTTSHLETLMALWDVYGLPKNEIWKYYTRDERANNILLRLGIETAYKELQEV